MFELLPLNVFVGVNVKKQELTWRQGRGRKKGAKQGHEICVSCRLLRLISTHKQHYTLIKMHFVCFQHWAFCKTVQPKDWNQACSAAEDFMGRLLSKYKSKEDNERWSGRQLPELLPGVYLVVFWFFFCSQLKRFRIQQNTEDECKIGSVGTSVVNGPLSSELKSASAAPDLGFPC